MRGPSPPAPSQRAPLGTIFLLAIGAASLFAVSFDDGGYTLASRSSWAIAVWWAIALCAATGWLRPFALPRATWLVAALLAGFALVTLASVAWTANDARAFGEFNRIVLYLGAFLLLSAAAPRAPLGRWCDAIALALTAVAAVALVSRFLPHTISDRGVTEAFPAVASRLSYPVGYWNGLAILVALAVPLLLHRAAADGPGLARALAVAPVPAIAATIYFASSRGGFGVVAVGVLVFLLLGGNRWSIAGGVATAGLCSAVVLAYLARHPDVANEPLTAAGAQRAEAALVIVAGCLVAAGLQAVLSRVLGRRRVPRPFSVAAIVAALLLATVGVVAARPAERFSEFKQPPPVPEASDDVILSHLVSLGGTGRWQLWESSVDAWEDRPLIGQGAGSFEAWWTENGSLAVFVRDAHSLYLETLAELGVLGFVLLAAALAAGAAGALVRVRTSGRAERQPAAAAAAVFVAFGAAAAIDWVWELPAVSLTGLSCLALVLAAPRTAEGTRRHDAPVRAAAVLVALALVGAQAVQLLADAEVRASRAAAASDDLGPALAHAERATEIQSWAPEPWLQLALVREQVGRLEQARDAIRRALAEDRRDWRLWLVSARIETKLGEISEARAALDRARSLNPRSRLFAELDGDA